MRHFAKLMFLVVLAAAMLYLQQSGFLTVHGITPNLLLIMFMVRIIRGIRWAPLIVAVSCVVALVAAMQPFWLLPFAVLAGVILAARGVRRLLTGNGTADFFILLAGGSIAHDAILEGMNPSLFSLSTIAWNLVYTFCFGALAWLGVVIYGKKIHSN